MIEETNLSNNTVKSYVWFAGKLLTRVDGVIGSTGAKYFFENDQVGSPLVVTDTSGKMAWQGNVTPFGSEIKNYGESFAFEDSLRFTWKDWDQDVGLYYFNARWMDPELGRFISEDPLGDSQNPNLYTYCANNPLVNTDPSGTVITSDGAYDTQSGQYYGESAKYVPEYVINVANRMGERYGYANSYEFMLQVLLLQTQHNGDLRKSQTELSQVEKSHGIKLLKRDYGYLSFCYNISDVAADPLLWQFMFMNDLFEHLGHGFGLLKPGFNGIQEPIQTNGAEEFTKFNFSKGTGKTSTGGASRAAQYSSSWGNASLKEVVNDIAPGSTPVVTDSGKIIYKNALTGKQIVYDIEGNYFRFTRSIVNG